MRGEVYLSVAAGSEDAEVYQGEDNTITYTAVFPDGIEMDIKCCGCDDEPSWTEAVLFNDKGGQICCTEPCDTFEGRWEIENNNVRYVAIVEPAPNAAK